MYPTPLLCTRGIGNRKRKKILAMYGSSICCFSPSISYCPNKLTFAGAVKEQFPEGNCDKIKEISINQRKQSQSKTYKVIRSKQNVLDLLQNKKADLPDVVIVHTHNIFKLCKIFFRYLKIKKQVHNFTIISQQLLKIRHVRDTINIFALICTKHL